MTMFELISRDEAIVRGLTRYFTGEPCRRGGHIAERMVSNWSCVICLKEKRLAGLRRRRREGAESIKALDRRDNARNLEYKKRWARTAGKLAKKLDKQRRRAGPAMPPWADQDEIKKVYEETPPGMVVDHKVPLFHYTEEGCPVCGLHIAENLQYIPQSRNAGKIHRDRPDRWAPGWRNKLMAP